MNNSIGSRLENIPIGPMHRFVVGVLAFAYFCDLVDLNTFAYAAPGIIGAWNIPVYYVAAITSVSFAGGCVGGLLGGYYSDRFGRKPVFIAGVLLYALCSVVNGLAWDIYSLGAFRFMTGIGLAAMLIAVNAYISEFFPAKVRGRYASLVFTIGLIGIPATAWVARYLVPVAPWGWRLVFFWGGLGFFVIPFALKLVESPRWLASKGRMKEAERAVEKLERSAGFSPSTLPMNTREEPPTPPRPWKALFNQDYRYLTLSICVLWMIETLGFNGFIAWVPTLLVKEGFAIAKSLEYSSLIAVCNPIGAFLAIHLVERFERKRLIMVDAIVVAIVGISYGLSHTPMAIVLFGMVLIIALQLMVATLYTYTSEIFPTDLRASGSGLAYGCGRVANVFGPFIIGALYTLHGYLSVFIYIAVCFVGVFCLAGFGPRTTGRSVETVAS